MEGVTFDRCPACHGLWFDAAEVTALAGNDRLEARVASAGFGIPSFACPRCGKVCHEVFLGNVAVDACRSCGGLWFDRFEVVEVEREIAEEEAADPLGSILPRLRGLIGR